MNFDKYKLKTVIEESSENEIAIEMTHLDTNIYQKNIEYDTSIYKSEICNQESDYQSINIHDNINNLDNSCNESFIEHSKQHNAVLDCCFGIIFMFCFLMILIFAFV